jgi:hypothetical protein
VQSDFYIRVQVSSFHLHSVLMPVYPEVQFGHIFRFLLSAGPSYSALPVNAKEYSGVVCFRRKLLFIDVLILRSWIPM